MILSSVENFSFNKFQLEIFLNFFKKKFFMLKKRSIDKKKKFPNL